MNRLINHGGMEISMISEQVRELRSKSNDFRRCGGDAVKIAKMLNEAADTIEELSAKVTAENMERSAAYYNGGWILCKDRLPTMEECAENDCRFIVYGGERVYEGYFMPSVGMFVKFNADGRGTVEDKFVVEWRPLPKPYGAKDMRIDLPLCSFKDCRYNFDGNCTSKPKKQNCEFETHLKLLEKCVEEIENLYGKETELTKEMRGCM